MSIALQMNEFKPQHNVAEPINISIKQSDFKVFLNEQDAGSVDLILTDPPYIISRETGFVNVRNGVKRFAVNMDFGDWDKVAINLDDLATGAYRALRKGGTAIIWYDIWKISDIERALSKAGFKMIRLIVWQKTNPVPLNQKATYLSNSREVAIVGVKVGKPFFNGTYHNGIYKYPIPRHGGRKIHPTQKPVDLFAELIGMHADKNSLVMDPFLGSGTTAEAAYIMKQNFKGCDIDEKYVSLAKERIARITNDK